MLRVWRMKRWLLLATAFLFEGAVASNTLTIHRNDLNLYVTPRHHPIAAYTNQLWDEFDQQASPTPPIAEGLFTLYGYSETAWGVANLRALDYEQCLAYGTCVRHDRGELFVYLRDCGTARFRACLREKGFDGVLALKADDVGRVARTRFYDRETGTWTEPVRLLVLDSLGHNWSRLRDTWHPITDGVRLRWLGDVSKDALETAGLGRLVRNNWSGFMRLEFEEVAGYTLIWPDYD